MSDGPRPGGDSLSRLIDDRGRSYSYDDAGNRLSDPDGAIAYPTPPAQDTDRWLSAENGALAYTFDAAGNVVQRGGTSIVTADDGTVIGISTTAGETSYVRDFRNLRL